jgi:hypothetical protein
MLPAVSSPAPMQQGPHVVALVVALGTPSLSLNFWPNPAVGVGRVFRSGGTEGHRCSMTPVRLCKTVLPLQATFAVRQSS